MSSLPDLPPKVPTELDELLRAIQLLGAVGQAGNRIRPKHQRELETLLGCSPDQQHAAHWKKHLKEIRRDLAAELKLHPDEDD
jgi:hypothetical protein